MKYRIFRNISVLCPSLPSFHSYLLIFPLHTPLSHSLPLSLSILSSSFIFILYSSLFLTISLRQSSSSIFFLADYLVYLSLSLSIFLSFSLSSSRYLSILIFLVSSMQAAGSLGFLKVPVNTRTLPVTLYAFHIYVKYTRVMSVDWCWLCFVRAIYNIRIYILCVIYTYIVCIIYIIN